jgi:3-phosphoshikimate 1-carboxyvinyltransferase
VPADLSDARTLPDPYPIAPLAARPDVTIRVPGGRSITNRALICAALADGTSRLEGAGLSDDSEAMIDCLRALGATIEVKKIAGTTDLVVTGVAGRPRGGVDVFTRLSGTTSRFITPVAALAGGPVRIDALPPMRARPMADLVGALRDLGVEVQELGEAGHLPIVVTGPPRADSVTVAGDVSSQFISGLMLMAGARPGGLAITRSTDRFVSAPYVHMTKTVMEHFGAVMWADPFRSAQVRGGGYRATTYRVEPDAATAGYFFAGATITGGAVTVPGVPSARLQADARLIDLMEGLGALVRRGADDVTVTGPPVEADGRVHLRGGTFDLTDYSDMAPTVAVLAAFADDPVEVTGVGFIRGKESDRIAASVAELRRVGAIARETDDGFVVEPSGDRLHGAVIETYDDHRMAMAFALLGLVVPGVSIADPGCVAKTHPGFFADLDRLR